jgi:hypothetical protein
MTLTTGVTLTGLILTDCRVLEQRLSPTATLYAARPGSKQRIDLFAKVQPLSQTSEAGSAYAEPKPIRSVRGGPRHRKSQKGRIATALVVLVRLTRRGRWGCHMD